MKIDCHIHITPKFISENVEAISEKEQYFGWLSASPQNKFATGEEVVEMLEREGFDKGIVFGFAFKDPALCKAVNDYTMEMVKKYPEKLIGFMVVSPEDKAMADEIARCVKGGLVGIGELFPEGQGWDLTGAHEKYPLGACCEKYGLPLLWHTNEPVGHAYAGKTKTTLQEVEAFVQHHPKTPIILAHLGGGLMFYETMKEVREQFSNVYYDTAAALFLYDPTLYQVADTIGIMEKIVFGSDFPLVTPSRYESGFVKSDISGEALKGMMGKNMVKLLKC